jgi:hypothetical protein
MAHAKGYNFLKWLACFPNTTSVQTFVTIRKELKKIFYIEADEILLAFDNDTRKSVWISYNTIKHDMIHMKIALNILCLRRIQR